MQADAPGFVRVERAMQPRPVGPRAGGAMSAGMGAVGVAPRPYFAAFALWLLVEGVDVAVWTGPALPSPQASAPWADALLSNMHARLAPAVLARYMALSAAFNTVSDVAASFG